MELDPDALSGGLATPASPEVVLVGAVGRDADGRPGYLSKRMPSVWTFFLRGFARVAEAPLRCTAAHYEYRDLPSDRDVTLVSGSLHAGANVGPAGGRRLR